MRKITFAEIMAEYNTAKSLSFASEPQYRSNVIPEYIKDPNSYNYFGNHRYWISEGAVDLPESLRKVTPHRPMFPLVIIEVAGNCVGLGAPGRNEFVGVATVNEETVFYTDVELPGFVSTIPTGMYSGPSVERLIFDLELRRGYGDTEYNRILQSNDSNITILAHNANAYRFKSESKPLNIPGLRLEICLINAITGETLILAAYVDAYDEFVGEEWLKSNTDWHRRVRNGYPSCYTLFSVGYTLNALFTGPKIEHTYVE